MIRFYPRRAAVLTSAVLLLFAVGSSLHAQETKGQRIYFTGHSFHYFMPPILADIAKKAGIKDHTQLGLSAIGGSRVYQHWAPAQTATLKTAKDVVLPAETITVQSTARFPSAGELTVATSAGDVTVTYTGKTATTFTGCKGGKGTLSSLKKVASTTNEARELLKAGKIDVFTMAPIFLPDNGIDDFVKLGVENNPKIRIFVQEFWLPWDHYDPAFKAPKDKVDHNAQTVESLQKSHSVYFKAMDEHVAELNKKYKTTAVHVAPVGQAVLKLRAKIIAGEVPGLKDQDDLFSDAIGHAKTPLQALVAYCWYGLIYEKSPVGLPVPAVLANAKENQKLNRLLQEIAWEAVTSHPQSGVQAGKEGAKAMIGTVERLDPRFDKLIPKDAQLEKIAEGFIWTEGAVWYKPGKCLLFSDIPNNVVVKWEPGKGTSEFLKPSGYTGAKARGGKAGDEPGSNGLSVDAQGRLYLCEHGDRRVTRIEKDGKKTVLADNYMGKKLNSPNDLALHPNGDVYFTDPPYGLAKGDKRELDFTGVFRISGKDGTISLVSKSLSPNGIALSPDLKKLYVTNGGSWMVFPVNEDGTTGEGKVFVTVKQWNLTSAKGGGLDGLKCDAQGNLFATGPGGVCVIAPDGALLGRFLTDDRTANLCFGGEDGRTLFVCVNHRMGMVRTTTKGIGW